MYVCQIVNLHSSKEDAITDKFGKECRYESGTLKRRMDFAWSSSLTREADWMN